MKICVVSDSHDHRERLAAAVADAKARGAQAVLHCGILVAPSTLHAAVPYGLPIHVIHGNNAGDLYHLCRLAQTSNGLVTYHGQDARLALAGRRIFLVHYALGDLAELRFTIYPVPGQAPAQPQPARAADGS